MKIHPVGAELFHANRGTDMMNLTFDLHNSENVPKNNFASSHAFLCVTVIQEIFGLT
jgi:hypothetical protein